MKKFGIFAALILFISMISGCSQKAFEADEDTIYVEDKGSVIGVIVEDCDKDYYNSEELESIINEEIAAYNESVGEGSVAIDTFEVKDKVVKVFTNYKTGIDYEEFNGVEFFSGTIAEALEAGYEFDTDLLDRNGEKISKDELLEKKAYKVVILEEIITVQVDGKILYHSENTEVKADDKAYVIEETEELAYIIYK